MQALDGVTRSSVEQAFEVIERAHVDGLIVATTSSVLAQRQQIVGAAARLRSASSRRAGAAPGSRTDPGRAGRVADV